MRLIQLMSAEIREAVARQHLQDEQLGQRSAAEHSVAETTAATATEEADATAAAQAQFLKPPALSSKPAPGE